MIHRRLRILALGLVAALLLAACSVDRDQLSTLGSAAFFSSSSVGFSTNLVAPDSLAGAELAPQGHDPADYLFPNTFLLDTEGVIKRVRNDELTVDISAIVAPVVSCTNLGGTESPGQNYQTVEIKDSAAVIEITKNGKAGFDKTTDLADPFLPGGAYADLITGGTQCANPNWTAALEGVDVQAVVLELFYNDPAQYGEDPVDTVSYTCVTTLVPGASTLSCTAD